MEFGFLAELLDFFLGETRGAGDGDLLLLARALVDGRDVQDAVGVDVEGHFDLRFAAARRLDAVELERAELLVVLRHRAFALDDDDVDGRLAVGGGGEDLRLLGRDGRVAFDHRRGDAAHGLDGQGERSHVEEEDVLHVALEHAGLDGGADGDDFVRVDALMGFLAGEAAGDLDDLGHAGHAADEDEFVDLGHLELGVLEAGLERTAGALGEVVADLLHLGAGERDVQVLRAGGVGGDERQVDVHGVRGREGDLGLLGFFLEALAGHGVLGEVDAGLRLEAVDEPLDDAFVPVVAAELGVAVGRLHFEDAAADLEDRDVEGAATEVIDRDLFVALLVEAVGEGSRGGLVDDAEHLEARDRAGVLGGLALRVVEVGGDGDHGLRDLLAEVGFGVGLELGEDLGGDFFRREHARLAVDFAFDGGVAVLTFDDLVRELRGDGLHFRELAADEALRGEDRVLRVGDGLALGGLTDEDVAVLGERDDGGRGARAFRVGDDDGLACFQDGHAGIGGAEVDADDFTHMVFW